MFTGIRRSAATQQRVGHRHPCVPPQLEQPVKELSGAGGKLRLRTPLGEPCVWRDYQAICWYDQATGAWFQDYEGLIGWVNQHPRANPVTGLGDGHDGIWNLIGQVVTAPQRRDILDWYPVRETLHKVEMTPQRSVQAEALLWQGQVEATRALLAGCPNPHAQHFCAYLEWHRQRLVNYEDYHTEPLCSIGSGAVESTVKQLGRRTQISGAQGKPDNVPQVLAHRCAYLNGSLRL